MKAHRVPLRRGGNKTREGQEGGEVDGTSEFVFYDNRIKKGESHDTLKL